MSETQVTGEPAEDTADVARDDIVLEGAGEGQDGGDADGEDEAEDGGEEAEEGEES